jgi:hypothetical protein
MELPNKPKKRGRKPKKKIVDENDNVKKITESMVIKLKHTIEEEDIIKPFDNENNINECMGEENTNNVGEVCWNCCHKFNNIVYGVPLKYINNIFYIYGDFCSLECCCRYSLENFNKSHEIISLINLFNNKLRDDDSVENIEIAPNKLLLKMFGGSLTIDEYRSNFKNNNIHDIKIPPILPISHSIDTYEINTQSSKNNLKLFRKNPLVTEEKSITKSMNLSLNQ